MSVHFAKVSAKAAQATSAGVDRFVRPRYRKAPKASNRHGGGIGAALNKLIERGEEPS